MEISKERDVKFGIVEHPGEHYAIKNDRDLREYIDKLREYPVFIGLQPVYLNWSEDFSKELLDEVDYILMDPQTIPLDDGNYNRIWTLDSHVEDIEEFMQQYMAHSLKILEEEPIDIFGWPLFLPVCIAREYYTVWTEERMQLIISKAKARNIAIEINQMAHVPHAKFIKMAKAEGLKFSFGSDSRNFRAGYLPYCKEMIKVCNLTESDMFNPGHD
jgi:histidinol phosphatase-like PHP family hydrolase